MRSFISIKIEFCHELLHLQAITIVLFKTWISYTDELNTQKSTNHCPVWSERSTLPPYCGILLSRNYAEVRGGVSLRQAIAHFNRKVVLFHHLVASIGNYKPFGGHHSRVDFTIHNEAYSLYVISFFFFLIRWHQDATALHLSMNFGLQMNPCATMKGKHSKWATSGRKSTWAPSVPARATADSGYHAAAFF